MLVNELNASTGLRLNATDALSWPWPMRRLYSARNSAAVESGISRISVVSSAVSIGDFHSPLAGVGATDPVSRRRASQRCTVQYQMPNSFAKLCAPPLPAAGAATTRSRKSMSYPYAMRALK